MCGVRGGGIPEEMLVPRMVLSQEKPDHILQEAATAHRRVAHGVAGRGAVPHRWAEAYLKGLDPRLPEEELPWGICPRLRKEGQKRTKPLVGGGGLPLLAPLRWASVPGGPLRGAGGGAGLKPPAQACPERFSRDESLRPGPPDEGGGGGRGDCSSPWAMGYGSRRPLGGGAEALLNLPSVQTVLQDLTC